MAPNVESLPDAKVAGLSLPFDTDLGVYCIYALVPRPYIVDYKILIESYESLGVVRSLDPNYEPGKGLTCLFAVADGIAQVASVVEELASTIGLEVVRPTTQMAAKAYDDVMMVD